MTDIYNDVVKDVKSIIDDLLDPVMHICGAIQYIPDEEGHWQILWIFDEYDLFVINIHISRSWKNVYIKGFRNKRKGIIDDQINYFVNQLKQNGTVKIMKNGTELVYDKFNYQVVGNTISRILEWVPSAIILYIDGIGKEDYDPGSFTLECDYDPEYFDNVKDGITNTQYRDLFTRRFVIYEL